MATFEIEGKLKAKLASQGGTSSRGEWLKQDFVLEYQDGNFPAEICLSAFGQDKVSELERFQTGDAVRVSFNIKAREYNGRWYNDLRVWKIAAGGAEAPKQSYSRAAGTAAAAPSPTIADMPSSEETGEDLPF